MAIYLNIIIHLDITKYPNIVEHILENIKLKKKDRSLASLTFSIYIFAI